MSRHRTKAIDPKACECCLVQIATEEHHRQPRSQNGGEEPENKPRVCGDCHTLYNIHCMTLAKTPEARVRNFALWLAEWPDCKMELCGKKKGPNPFVMAPEFLLDEWALFNAVGETDDFSEGCLSNLGKITPFYFPKRKD